jgi:hypothetical protein
MERKPSTDRPIVLPIISSAICIIVFTLAGWFGSVLNEMASSFSAAEPPMKLKIASSLRWYFTMPVGCILAFALMRGRKVWAKRTNQIVDSIAILGSAGIILFMMFAPSFEL